MLYRQLQQLQAADRPIRIGCYGAGAHSVGPGFVTQVGHVPGMEVAILADADVATARAVFELAGVPPELISECSAPGAAMDAIQAGQRVVTGDLTLAAQVDVIDIVTDATASPASGAAVALAGIENGKDVVLINCASDATVGRILRRKAVDAGVLYSISSGSVPGSLMALWEYAQLLGFETIAVGQGRDTAIDPSATPETMAAAAAKASKDAYLITSHADGTQTMLEMTCIANATGCLPMQRGMVGRAASLETVNLVFMLREDGGIVTQPGVVDFVRSQSMAGGLFITCRVHDRRIGDGLRHLSMSNGKYITFFHPYHLSYVEAPIAFAEAYLQRKVTLAPLDLPMAETIAVAKRDLQLGDILDEIGGFTFHGVIDRADAAQSLNALPAGVASGAIVVVPVRKGQIIRWTDVELNESSPVVALRREQDQP
jgi:predicted homoserine dehydrogenase-like protein